MFCRPPGQYAGRRRGASLATNHGKALSVVSTAVLVTIARLLHIGRSCCGNASVCREKQSVWLII